MGGSEGIPKPPDPMFRQRKRDLELEVLHLVKALCQSEPDSTTEKILTDALRKKAEPWLTMIGAAS